MSYGDSVVKAGRVIPRQSVTAGAAPSLRPGEIAANAADGCLYVGTTGGTATPIAGSPGITQIVSLSESQYTAQTATLSATTLYIVTPD